MLMRRGKRSAIVLALSCALPILALRLVAHANPAAGAGHYTTSQAEAGKAVFDTKCAICHGDHLQGGVGPALSGEQFLSVSQFQQITAEYYYHFISTHMPLNDPGSLSKTQYLNIMAYMLEVNGYSAGQHALTDNKEELQTIKIEPQH